MNDGVAPHSIADPPARRSFLVGAAAVVVSVFAAIFPFAAGLGVFFDPLRRRGGGQGAAGNAPGDADFVRICPLDSLPGDGVPHEFPITADLADAWTRVRGQRVGSVFVARQEKNGQPTVTAFTAACPHLGCAVEFDTAERHFACPCHESAFAMNGDKLFGPSLRGLDPLEAKLVDHAGTKEIWAKFERFKAGIAEREPIG